MKNDLRGKFKYLAFGLIGILAIITFALGFNMSSLKADSGWDTSYDSSSSSSSSSSWSSSSSSSSSSSWSSDGYSSSGGSVIGTIVAFAFILLIIILISRFSQQPTTEEKPSQLSTRKDIDEKRIKELLPEEDLGSLKHMAFEKFVAIQNAWMDFEYEKLRTLCTDELYNSYVAQLDALKIKNGKNFMNAFDQKENRIVGIKEENGMVTVTVFMIVEFYDYVINAKTKEVIRGNQYDTVTNKYEMEFVRKKDIKEKTVKCPNCGNKVKVVTSAKCDYCGSTVVIEANDYVLSKKRIVNY